MISTIKQVNKFLSTLPTDTADNIVWWNKADTPQEAVRPVWEFQKIHFFFFLSNLSNSHFSKTRLAAVGEAARAVPRLA